MPTHVRVDFGLAYIVPAPVNISYNAPFNPLLIAMRTDQQQAIAPLCTDRLILNLNKDKISSFIHSE